MADIKRAVSYVPLQRIIDLTRDLAWAQVLGVILPLLIFTHAHLTPNEVGLLPLGATDVPEVLCQAVWISVTEGPACDLGVLVMAGKADREMKDSGELGIIE